MLLTAVERELKRRYFIIGMIMNRKKESKKDLVAGLLCFLMTVMTVVIAADTPQGEVLEGNINEQPKAAGEMTDVILGDERFDLYLSILENERVAVFTNQTGIVGDEILTGDDEAIPHRFGQDSDGNEIQYGIHIVDALIQYGVDVTAIISPEHGFRGTEDAGASIENSVDERTGLPILSLYTSDKTNSLTTEDMDLFDTLIVDMQDVGLRYYTYYISLYYLMDACAREGKQVVILDRPNPNGFYVDGPILKEEYKSNVGVLPLPVIYGMTWGELAQMINGEGWLTAGKDACELKVVPCDNYTHQTKYELIKRPSPNLKDMRAVYLYASLCYFENTVVSVGRGTEYPFEVYGCPYFEGIEGNDYSFTPESMEGATEPPYKGEICYGHDLRNVDMDDIFDQGINMDYMIDAYKDYVFLSYPDGRQDFFGTPDENGHYWIDLLFGTNEVRNMINQGKSADEIKASWQDDIDLFKEQREPYLLY